MLYSFMSRLLLICLALNLLESKGWAAASLLIPWYNDSGGQKTVGSLISITNSSPLTATVTVTYRDNLGQDSTPRANTFLLGPEVTRLVRPFQKEGAGEAEALGPYEKIPKATAEAPFGSALFVNPAGEPGTLKGSILRFGSLSSSPMKPPGES